MTQKERLIVSAYTGVIMTDWGSFHAYAESVLGRLIWTHEFHYVAEELKQKVKKDFLALCGDDYKENEE